MKRTPKLLALVGTSLLGANVAQAGFSTISPSLDPEPTHADIFGSTFGGTFTANGLNFSNGSITATRVDDDTDLTWTNEGGPTKVAGITSNTDTVTFAAGKYTLDRGDIQFTSDPADNVDGKDHMVTYTLSGSTTGYVLFFEDANDLKPRSDFDYNDVVLAQAVSVPLPAALASGLFSLGGLGVVRAVRKGRKS